MATEKLIVELDAKTQKLDAALKETDSRLGDLDKSVKKTDSTLNKLGATAKSVAGIALKTAAAAVAVGTALSAMVVSASSSRRELELLSKQAKTSAEDFQALSFATNTYGINGEQIADISKDIADKIGEFSAAGTGAFQDYADVMKLSKVEALAAAKEFEGLSSQEILGKMVSRMEDASVSGDKMTFVLESLGNDASRLIPLFSENSKELKLLKERFNDVNGSLQITAGQAEKLREVSTSFDLMTSSIGNASTAISATIAPVVNDFFNDVIAVVPDATQAIIDFTNSFLDAENITSIVAVNKEIEKSVENIAFQESRITNQKGHSRRVAEQIKADEEERLDSLKKQLAVLEDQERLADAKRTKSTEIGGTEGSAISSGTGDEIQKIADRFKTEEELLTEKLNNELIIVGDNKALRLELEKQYIEDALSIEYEAAEARKRIGEEEQKDFDRNKKAETASAEKTARDKIKAEDAYMNAANVIGNTLFENSKGVQAGLIVANAATAVIRQYADLPIYAAVPASIAVGVAAASQLASLNSASSKGGSLSTPSGSAPVTQSQQFQNDTASLDISDSTTQGSQVFSINVPDGDEIGEAIANWLNKAQTEGRV